LASFAPYKNEGYKKLGLPRLLTKKDIYGRYDARFRRVYLIIKPRLFMIDFDFTDNFSYRIIENYLSNFDHIFQFRTH